MANRYRRQHVVLMLGLGLLLWWTGARSSYAQVPLPHFGVDVVTVKAQDSAASRVDVYTKVLYKNLQFISAREGFSAGYSITATLYQVDDEGRRGGLVTSESWDHTVAAANFAATQSTELGDYALGSIIAAPGRYALEVRLEDAHTEQASVHDLMVHVRDFSQPVALSDLILIRSYDASDQAIVPIVPARVTTEQPSFRLFCEIYSEESEQVRIMVDVMRVHKSSGSRSLVSIFGLGGNDELGEITYTRAEPTQLQAGRTQRIMEIPMTELQAGEYRVRIRIEDPQGRVLDAAEKLITAEWVGLTNHIRNVDQAIDQLAYIAKDEDLTYMKDGRTPEERLKRFEAFWEKRDPTPGTDRNERMEEYYYRIAHANRSYAGGVPGWRTDRGQVLVLFGEPDRVEQHADGGDAQPYEIWFYNRIGKQFIFVDESGRGDFKLMVPIWDERTRLR